MATPTLVTGVLTGGKTIALSKGKAYATVDVEDFDYLNQWSWKLTAGRATRNKHIGTVGNWRDGRRKDITILMHRLIMSAPQGMDVDHINGDPLDNRKANLRVCTHAENRRNTKRPISNTSGFKGVSLDKRYKTPKWIAFITFMNKSYNLGAFDSPKEAALEYDHVARQLFGDFAKFNFGDR